MVWVYGCVLPDGGGRLISPELTGVDSELKKIRLFVDGLNRERY